MCGRYILDSEASVREMHDIIDEINRRYKDTERLAAMKTGEIFPTDTVPVISKTGPQLMRWGFPMQRSGRAIINAKSETVSERAMFRAAVAARRVVVPTTGFFEWTHAGGKAKDKFLFRLPGEDMLYLAGIFTAFQLPAGTELRFAVITTAANAGMAPFHDRMPVVIGKSELNAWINDGAFAGEALRREQPELSALRIS